MRCFRHPVPPPPSSPCRQVPFPPTSIPCADRHSSIVPLIAPYCTADALPEIRRPAAKHCWHRHGRRVVLWSARCSGFGLSTCCSRLCVLRCRCRFRDGNVIGTVDRVGERQAGRNPEQGAGDVLRCVSVVDDSHEAHDLLVFLKSKCMACLGTCWNPDKLCTPCRNRAHGRRGGEHCASPH